MAGQDRMTVAQVVREVLRDEHADVIRESVRAVAQELMEVEISELIGAERGERTEDRASSSPYPRPTSEGCMSRPGFRGGPEARMLSWLEGSLLSDACVKEVRR